MTRRPLLVVAAVAVAAVLVVGVLKLFGGDPAFTVHLPEAAGIREGDEVRIAGIEVGEVGKVEAVGAEVQVRITVHDEVAVTTGTRTEVKLSSLLGQRYLELTPGPGRRLRDGADIPLANANGSYTIERFWIESAPTLTEIDLKTLSRAVDVLSTDLAVEPRSSQDALAGMAQVAELVAKRDAQLGELLATTRRVTDEVVAQRTELTSLLTSADQVLAMVVQRKRSLDTLIGTSEVLARELASMSRANAKPMTAALMQLRIVLKVLRGHRADLARTLELASPAMRLYVNSAGDGPWLGVNAPYFILPDAFWCLTRKDIGCR